MISTQPSSSSPAAALATPLALLEGAERICPYSNATRGLFGLEITPV